MESFLVGHRYDCLFRFRRYEFTGRFYMESQLVRIYRFVGYASLCTCSGTSRRRT